MLCVLYSWFVWFNKDQQQHSNVSSTKGAYTDIKKKRKKNNCALPRLLESLFFLFPTGGFSMRNLHKILKESFFYAN